MIRLSKEEREILEAYEKGELERVDNMEELIEQHRAAAEAMFKKDARINIRLSSRDLRALQSLALREGIPYQTLVSSILHKYVDGRLVERGTE
jgi:predicted DNA binding CopG/RHH family protein